MAKYFLILIMALASFSVFAESGYDQRPPMQIPKKYRDMVVIPGKPADLPPRCLTEVICKKAIEENFPYRRLLGHSGKSAMAEFLALNPELPATTTPDDIAPVGKWFATKKMPQTQ